jgi:ribonuclease VapC
VIIDTSALIAILRDEPEAASFAEAIRVAEVRRISAATYVEVGIVIDRAGDAVASRRLDDLIAAMSITIEPVTADQARLAREAHRDFGRGTGHRARLNFGDCLVYALAADLREPVLFKGDDFASTDIPYVGTPSVRRRMNEIVAGYSSDAPSS